MHVGAILTGQPTMHYVNQSDRPGEGLSLLPLSTKQAS
jgi:hypothetical protein